MKYIRGEEKNKLIKQQNGRMGVGFEDIIAAIQSGNTISDDYNDNISYQDQKSMIVIVH